MDDDPFTQRRERGFDAITLILAGALAAIVVGAIGYGIVKSSKVASVPLQTGHYQPPAWPAHRRLANRLRKRRLKKRRLKMHK